MIADAIPAWVEPYLTVPYRDGGRDRAGWDCFGLVRTVLAERAGIALPAYDLISAAEMIAFRRWGTGGPPPASWRDVTNAQMFDLVLMRGRPFHLGVMVSPTHVLHCEAGTGAACVPLSRLAPRFLGLYRHSSR